MNKVKMEAENTQLNLGAETGYITLGQEQDMWDSLSDEQFMAALIGSIRSDVVKDFKEAEVASENKNKLYHTVHADTFLLLNLLGVEDIQDVFAVDKKGIPEVNIKALDLDNRTPRYTELLRYLYRREFILLAQLYRTLLKIDVDIRELDANELIDAFEFDSRRWKRCLDRQFGEARDITFYPEKQEDIERRWFKLAKYSRGLAITRDMEQS